MEINKMLLTPGDIYQEINTGEFFIVSKVTIENNSTPNYFHVSLKDGHSRWWNSKPSRVKCCFKVRPDLQQYLVGDDNE